MDHFEPLQIVGFALRIENLLLITPFIVYWSFLLTANFAAGEHGEALLVRAIIGIFLSVALFSCYLMIVLDYTARGYQKPPKMSGDLIDSVKSRFFKSTLAVSVFLSVSASLGSSNAQIPFLLLTAMCFPFVMAIIAIQDSFTRAVNPWNWWLFLRAIAWDKHVFNYLLCISLFLISAYLVFSSAHLAITIPLVAIATALLLTLFRAIGVLIRANATSLGLPVRFSAEIERQQLDENKRLEEADFTEALYRLVAADRIKQAWTEYQDYVGGDIDVMQRLWPIVSKWSNPALALLAGQVYIERLIERQQFVLAWEILTHCFVANGHEFKLLEGKTTLALTNRAETSQQRKIAGELLRFFAKDFPNHPDAAEATLTAVELLIAESDNSPEAKKLLQQIRIKYPQLAKQERYQALAKLAESPD